MVIGFELLLHLGHLFFLRTYGSYHALAACAFGHHLRYGAFHSSHPLALGGLAGCLTGILFCLNDSSAVIGLRVEDGITDLANRLTAAGIQAHAHSYLTYFVERHTLEFL